MHLSLDMRRRRESLHLSQYSATVIMLIIQAMCNRFQVGKSSTGCCTICLGRYMAVFNVVLGPDVIRNLWGKLD